MTYEAQFWEMGGDDGNLVADFEDRLRRLVDENVRAATTEFWSKVRLSVRKGDDGVFLLEAWAEDAVGDEAVRAIPLIELGGFRCRLA